MASRRTRDPPALTEMPWRSRMHEGDASVDIEELDTVRLGIRVDVDTYPISERRASPLP